MIESKRELVITANALTSRLTFAAVLMMSVGFLHAGAIVVPNGSFESPSTPFADPRIDLWEQTGNQLTGVFFNGPGTSFIDNCDGIQAAFLFAVPGVTVFQDYNSLDYAHLTPTHSFNAKFEVGNSYNLAVGIIGGGGGMSNGVTMEINLYYRDAASNRVVIAATSVTNTAANFPTNTHFIDYRVQTPAVKFGDAWAGQYIGIELRSTVDPVMAGGYWDLDNVRLTEIIGPALINPSRTNRQFQFTMRSEPGLTFEILAATNVALSVSNWTSLGIVTNTNGATRFTDPATNLSQRFYRARQL